MTTFHARTVEDVQACVREHAAARTDAGARAGGVDAAAAALLPVAGRSKSALSSAPASCVLLDVSALAGVVEYQPAECTFTAWAGTRVADVEAMLAERGQYLPFEPPFADRGATLGGTVAAAHSGPGRFRYGGIRDFLLGVRFVDGTGRVIRGGGRVVKNAAGFYLQHLLLGSLGTLGVLTEITCKVFPRAQAQTTVVADYQTLTAAVDALARLRRSPFELEAAELVPPGRLLLRLGGSRAALGTRAASLSTWLRDTGAAAHQIVDDTDEQRTWHEARELTWAPASVPLVKVSTTLSRIARLDQQLTAAGANPARRYGAGGDITWIAWPHPLATLDTLLTDLDMPGLSVLGGDNTDPLLGRRPDAALLARVRQTLDPRGLFGRISAGD
jgi:glycolate oxidase FAD binding subunit